MHNFYVPQFRGKNGYGAWNYYLLLVDPNQSGCDLKFCAEYCGTGHYAMRGRVIVDEEKDYMKWEAKTDNFFEKMLAKSQKNDNLQLVKKDK